MEGQKSKEDPEQSLTFSLVLESRMRQLLERECRANKKGHHRKLTKRDHAAIDDEIKFLRFDPGRWFMAAQEQAQRRAQEQEAKDVMQQPLDAYLMKETPEEVGEVEEVKENE